ncbi:putative Auxin-induced protein 5NG4 [Tripterygium wilfordii]|uniref:WAT1-related protein n=1 Tax=Tripterygium wilfordii TaxID=458696 RepID=A0A7J7D3Y9_TRIWF|nr:putative Auxin-induced protein 5NG4 [Tripterygium wilfordii]
MTRGMNQYVFAAYSNGLGAIVLIPACFIFYCCGLWIIDFFWWVLYSLSMQIFMYIGMAYSSPTLASAMFDLTPAFTFFVAVASRMEKLVLKDPGSGAKSVGTLLSVAGALVVTLYKGQPISSVFSSSSSLTGLNSHLLLQSNWIIGAIFLVATAFILSLILVVVTWIIKDYPEEMIVVLISSFFVTIQCAIFTLFVKKNPNAWSLKLDIELVAIVYSAVIAVCIRSILYAWACRKEGPIYVSMFKPIDMVIATIMGVAFLGDTLYLGSVIGGIVITMGFYVVTWGQAQESKMIENSGNCATFDSSSPKAPLLQNTKIDVMV